MEKYADFIVIGAAILDILAQPVTAKVFDTGSVPAEHIVMHTGGDALNEASVLSSLGASVRLVSKIGKDDAGSFILSHCRKTQIDTSFLMEDTGLETGVNLVLIDNQAERYFITSKNGSLRKLYPADIPESALLNGKYLCFASIFVSPAFDNSAMTELFAKAKKQGLILCADMTKRKNAETLEDMKSSLSFLDYIFPNYEEASLLTGLTDWDEIADAFLLCGVKHVIIKAGARGCFIKTNSERYWIDAYKTICCTDTTGAGDTFTACFLYARNRGMNLTECGKFANAGASLCVEQVGSGDGLSLQQIIERYENKISSAL